MEQSTNWKDTFNLTRKPKQKMKTSTIVLIIIAVVAVAAIAKFAFIDRYTALNKLTTEVEEMKAKVEENQKEIQRIEELTDDYAHYTDADMTDEEMELVDRNIILKIIDKYIRPYASVRSWTLQENLLHIDLDSTTLDKINKIVADVNGHELVDYAYMQTATGDNEELVAGQEVKADLTIALSLPYDESKEVKLKLPEGYMPMPLPTKSELRIDSQEYYMECDRGGNVIGYYHLESVDEKGNPTFTKISEDLVDKGLQEEAERGITGGEESK